MKPILIVLTLIVLTQTAKCGWFNNPEKDRRIQAAEQQLVTAQQQLNNQSQLTSNWRNASTFLMVGCVISLIIGTAIGSRAKNHAKQPESTVVAEIPSVESNPPQEARSKPKSRNVRSAAKIK